MDHLIFMDEKRGQDSVVDPHGDSEGFAQRESVHDAKYLVRDQPADQAHNEHAVDRPGMLPNEPRHDKKTTEQGDVKNQCGYAHFYGHREKGVMGMKKYSWLFREEKWVEVDRVETAECIQADACDRGISG